MLTPELQALVDAPNNPLEPLDDRPTKSLAELLQAPPPGVDGKLLRQYAEQTESLEPSTGADVPAE